jgi:nitronate monooxygenase
MAEHFHSLIQAPMAGVQGSRLAMAVCQAGALGSLPAAMLSASALQQELETMRTLGGRPYNLNFFCHQPPGEDAQQQADWQSALTPYYQQMGIAPPGSGPGRTPFNQEMADIVSRYRPAVVSFHFGLPAAPLLAQVKAAGCKVLSSATTVAEARWLAANGVDAIIAQGLEAGGHRGMFLDMNLDNQLGSFALLPQIVEAVDVPVIAAGGIADAAGVAAAMRWARPVCRWERPICCAMKPIPPTAPCGTGQRTSRTHCTDYLVYRQACARHRQSGHAGAGPAPCLRTGLPAGYRHHRPLARSGRSAGTG